MADSKLTGLGAIPAYALDDVLYIVDTSTGLSKKTTVQAFIEGYFNGTLGYAGELYLKAASNIRIVSTGASSFIVRNSSDSSNFLQVDGLGITTVTNWLRQSSGRSRVATSAVTNNSITPTNITGLSATLIAGRAYSGVLTLKVSNTVAVDGLRLDFDGGTATMTLFEAGVTSAGLPAATFSVTQSSALATDIIATTMTDTNTKWIEINFGMVVNAAGTFIPRIALEALSTGVISVHPGSWMLLEDTP